MKQMKFSLLALVTALCSLTCGQLSAEETVILEKLRGIVLLGNWDLVQPHSIRMVDGIESVDVDLISSNTGFMAQLDKTYVGKPLTTTSLQAMKQSIADFYAQNRQPMVVVNAPQQEVTSGVLQLVVTQATLGEVRLSGNEYFSNTQLLNYIRTKPGQPIDSKTLREDMSFMNQNPFRRTDAVFVPGKFPGVTDLELLTIDRWPYRIYAGADNTGTIATNRNRIFAGFNLAKTIIPDTEVSFQYTQAPDVDNYYSLTGLVRVPLPWVRHTLQAFGGYAVVEPETGVADLAPRGKSWSVDLRYRIPIFEGSTDFLQTFVVGYDFKESNTNLFFGGSPDYYGIADINQAMIGYDLGVSSKFRKISFTAELYGSPSSITNHNTNQAFQSLRYAAKAAYAYLKVTHGLSQQIAGGCRVSYDIMGQVASTNLLPSEQLSMTGYHAVRGFEERILDLDNGAVVNVTFETPRVSLAKFFGSKKTYDELYLLAFFDTGFGGNHELVPGEDAFQSLGSIGPGVRYDFSRYITAHFDYGVQLWHSGFDNITDSRYNFGVSLSY